MMLKLLERLRDAVQLMRNFVAHAFGFNKAGWADLFRVVHVMMNVFHWQVLREDVFAVIARFGFSIFSRLVGWRFGGGSLSRVMLLGLFAVLAPRFVFELLQQNVELAIQRLQLLRKLLVRLERRLQLGAQFRNFGGLSCVSFTQPVEFFAFVVGHEAPYVVALQ
jgi:hypothetical protein